MKSVFAAIQMCSSTSIEANLAEAEKWITEAASKQAKLVVLPEMFATMNLSGVSYQESFGEGPIQAFLAEQARAHALWIIGGTIPISDSETGKVKAACLVFDDTGACVARYDKMHLFDVVLSETERYEESNTIAPGNNIVVVDSPFGKIGLAVCYDIRFPELFRIMFNRGAQIIVLPAAFTQKTGQAHWEILARSRAIENFCYFVGACQGGHHANGRTTYGHSLIVDPWGRVMAEKEDTDAGVILATIDLQEVDKARKAIPIGDHQRIFFDING